MAQNIPLTPGSAMSQVLQGSLERDRELQRQAMLDALQKRQIESNLETARINAEALGEQRKAYAQQMRAHADERTVGAFDEGQFGIGTDLSGRFDPEMQATLMKYGRLSPTNPNAGKGNEEDFAEGVFSAGSPKERERAKRKTAIQSLASQLGDPQMVNQLMALAELDDNITGTELSGIFKPQTKPVYRTRLDGTIEKVGDVPFNAQMTQVDRIPPGPQGPTPVLVQREDPNNPGKYFSGWVKPGDEEALNKFMNPAPPSPPPAANISPAGADRQGPSVQQGAIPAASGSTSGAPVYRGNVPVSATRGPSKISASEAGGLRSALAAMQKQNNASTQGALFTTQNQIISKYLPSDELKQAARSILAFPDRDKYSTADLIGMIKGNRPMSPAETEALNDVLSTVLGRF